MTAGVKIENGSRDPDHAPLRSGLLFISYDTMSTCISNQCGVLKQILTLHTHFIQYAGPWTSSMQCHIVTHGPLK